MHFYVLLVLYFLKRAVEERSIRMLVNVVVLSALLWWIFF